MIFTPVINLDAASSVAQINQGCVPGLGRGPGSKNILQSPRVDKTLKILQCNINGISTQALRVKLDQLLDLAERLSAQIVALQETKLRKTTLLKADEDTDMEIQGISFVWRDRSIKVFNVYHPPNNKQLQDNFNNITGENIIILGDLNAKHPMWGCATQNTRGNELVNLVDDGGFIVLNDGSPTHSSYSYNTSEALDVSIISPDLQPLCNWSVLNNIDSDHRPILLEINRKQVLEFLQGKLGCL
ncbi:hypothetical protein AVEN_137417-1 [Araneus ventricosus]|uniref:Endonuclease/exonuclease/phosphatase domain-containing protein n=1 Tax=Araneus ventricosus TaxID=182803 RepID=A0A4Y2UA24_ARAVE|nr:hypothetical protein AVEN_238906-1 [Araneus ventricosus]GBO09482.1 hypothetical protein AVEN_249707-1 [Araneus ventricosus]GBO09874.1 hypothetical protein AVEN_34252-1 [Araneus ventricosus]GBO09884.1 hypothetical protein AVEN_137417-1 [Araneus ventricosus]